MKTISKIVAGILLGAGLTSTAVAVEAPRYGLANEANKSVDSQATYVTLTNYSYDDYTAHAYYPVSGVNYYNSLGNIYSGFNRIVYTVSYPEPYVCLDITRTWDNAYVYLGCKSAGGFDIMPYKSAAAHSSEKPMINNK